MQMFNKQKDGRSKSKENRKQKEINLQRACVTLLFQMWRRALILLYGGKSRRGRTL